MTESDIVQQNRHLVDHGHSGTLQTSLMPSYYTAVTAHVLYQIDNVGRQQRQDKRDLVRMAVKTTVTLRIMQLISMERR
jgi:hypothetical protein